MIIEFLKSRTKYIFSFFKTNWTISNYPVRFKKQKVIVHNQNSRTQMYSWIVQIIVWYAICGHGNSKKEAYERLSENFNTI